MPRVVHVPKSRMKKLKSDLQYITFHPPNTPILSSWNNLDTWHLIFNSSVKKKETDTQRFIDQYLIDTHA